MSNELNHYGVKGMRWGVRRSENRSSGSRGKRGTPSKESMQKRKRIAKIAAGTAATVTVVAATAVYLKNKKQVDSFIAKNAGKVLKSVSDQRATKALATAKKREAYAKKNASKILKSPSLLNKYKDYYDRATVDEAVKNLQRTRDLHNLAQDDIRRGANYVNAVLAYGTAATAAYNLKNSQLAKDMRKKSQKKG